VVIFQKRGERETGSFAKLRESSSVAVQMVSRADHLAVEAGLI
jgi:hypothetical protein